MFSFIWNSLKFYKLKVFRTKCFDFNQIYPIVQMFFSKTFAQKNKDLLLIYKMRQLFHNYGEKIVMANNAWW